MGLRFRKSFKMAPGLRLNMSGSGFSWSFGPRGASINLGRRNTSTNLDLPGGFSYKSQNRRAQAATAPKKPLMEVAISVGADGTLLFADDKGVPINPDLEAISKKQQGPVIKQLQVTGCKDINEKLDGLEWLHVATPPPHINPSFTPECLKDLAPLFPQPKAPSLWANLFPWIKRRLEKRNEASLSEYHSQMRS